MEKWRAAQSPFSGHADLRAWLILILALLGILAAAALAMLAYSHFRQRMHRREFHGHAEELGLSGTERRLLLALAKASGLKRPSSVFTMAGAFERGASRLLESKRLAAMPDQQRQEAVALLGRLREKLGFENAPESREATSISFGSVAAGKVVSIFRRHLQDYFDAAVAASTPGGSGLEVKPERPIRCEPGETWQIRYDQEGLLWESDASVVKQARGRVILKLIGTARCINRRRFARTPTMKPAAVAVFPFLEGAADAGPQVFVPAAVTEIAGPGLRLEAPVEVRAGERVLLRVQSADGRTLQGLALVRRATPGANGMTDLAVEMVGLSTSEVAELIRETNRAIKPAEAEQAPVATEKG
ncbi:MAG: hypothetical protein AMJ81_02445 [Phycisphaerae bacterium SM23_33]|nr:MAG: hypothetical protein AMJ81_02445 [Phycisphaerae bacterium SM23_33]